MLIEAAQRSITPLIERANEAAEFPCYRHSGEAVLRHVDILDMASKEVRNLCGRFHPIACELNAHLPVHPLQEQFDPAFGIEALELA